MDAFGEIRQVQETCFVVAQLSDNQDGPRDPPKAVKRSSSRVFRGTRTSLEVALVLSLTKHRAVQLPPRAQHLISPSRGRDACPLHV